MWNLLCDWAFFIIYIQAKSISLYLWSIRVNMILLKMCAICPVLYLIGPVIHRTVGNCAFRDCQTSSTWAKTPKAACYTCWQRLVNVPSRATEWDAIYRQTADWFCYQHPNEHIGRFKSSSCISCMLASPATFLNCYLTELFYFTFCRFYVLQVYIWNMVLAIYFIFRW